MAPLKKGTTNLQETSIDFNHLFGMTSVWSLRTGQFKTLPVKTFGSSFRPRKPHGALPGQVASCSNAVLWRSPHVLHGLNQKATKRTKWWADEMNLLQLFKYNVLSKMCGFTLPSYADHIFNIQKLRMLLPCNMHLKMWLLSNLQKIRFISNPKNHKQKGTLRYK